MCFTQTTQWPIFSYNLPRKDGTFRAVFAFSYDNFFPIFSHSPWLSEVAVWPAFSKLHLLRKEDPVAVAFDVSPRRGTNKIFTRMSGTSVSGNIVTSLFSGKSIKSYIIIWPWK